jgi:hypothetical protein
MKMNAKPGRYRRVLLAWGLCWLSTSLQGQALTDTAMPTVSTACDPLREQVARIEQNGSRYVLTTYCCGTHSIYVQPAAEFDLKDYVGKYVRVAYQHIEVREPNIRCVRAPCEPVTETRAVILELERIDVSEAELKELSRICPPP